MNPPSGLDPTQTREARALIKSLAGTHTVLFSSHIMSEVEAVCQEVIIIARGKIVAKGTTDALRNRNNPRVFVGVRGPADQLKTALNSLPGVTGVEVLPAPRQRHHQRAGLRQTLPRAPRKHRPHRLRTRLGPPRNAPRTLQS